MIGNDDSRIAWLQLKWGLFSASEISKLYPPGKIIDKKTGQREMFSETGLSYIEKVACESYSLFNLDDNVETYDMKLGKMREPQAFQHLYKLIGLKDLSYFGEGNPMFFNYCKDSGCSPDVVALKPGAMSFDEGNVSFGAEIKAPKRLTHWQYLKTIRKASDLYALLPDYYGQCQFAIMTFKCDHWLWCSYNEYLPFNEQMVIIEVPRDDNWCNNMEMRLKQAVKLKYQEIEDVKNRNHVAI